MRFLNNETTYCGGVLAITCCHRGQSATDALNRQGNDILQEMIRRGDILGYL